MCEKGTVRGVITTSRRMLQDSKEVAGMERAEDTHEIALAVGGLWPEFKVRQEHPQPLEF